MFNSFEILFYVVLKNARGLHFPLLLLHETVAYTQLINKQRAFDLFPFAKE